jgi:AraC-like DNA-binding protein
MLVRGTDLKMARIAKDVGYASESAFTKAFKKVIRITPKEFRGASIGEPSRLSAMGR